MIVAFHLETIFEELVKVTDIVGTLEEVEEWYNTKRDENTHYYFCEIPKGSRLERIHSKDNYEGE